MERNAFGLLMGPIGAKTGGERKAQDIPVCLTDDEFGTDWNWITILSHPVLSSVFLFCLLVGSLQLLLSFVKLSSRVFHLALLLFSLSKSVKAVSLCVKLLLQLFQSQVHSCSPCKTCLSYIKTQPLFAQNLPCCVLFYGGKYKLLYRNRDAFGCLQSGQKEPKSMVWNNICSLDSIVSSLKMCWADFCGRLGSSWSCCCYEREIKSGWDCGSEWGQTVAVCCVITDNLVPFQSSQC